MSFQFFLYSSKPASLLALN